jgi:hypothetical protein
MILTQLFSEVTKGKAKMRLNLTMTILVTLQLALVQCAVIQVNQVDKTIRWYSSE